MIMYLSDYKGGSIVNLMASIQNACGGKSKYKECNLLSSKDLKKYKNIVLIVIDGLGYEYLIKKGKGSVFYDNKLGKLTSCFPSTTASCIPVFMTGVAPQQHGLTGWFMYLKEMGAVIIPLLFRYRNAERIKNFSRDVVFSWKPIHEKIKSKHFRIMPKKVVGKSRKEGKLTYYSCTNVGGLFKQIKKAMKSRGKKFIYAYWHVFDHKCHESGTKSKDAYTEFERLDNNLRSFVNSMKKDTVVIVTADHGQMDTIKSKIILIDKQHSKLNECLVMPLCGEPRVAYCYVRPNKVKDFEKYVRIKMKKYCSLYKSEELIKKGWFGLGKPNKFLRARVGDYILIMKDKYIIRHDWMRDKGKIRGKGYHVGNHGGVSKEEIFVPLIVIKKN